MTGPEAAAERGGGKGSAGAAAERGGGKGSAWLSGLVAVVTGAGTGIGAAVARRFVAEGAWVVLTGRRPGPLRSIAAALGERALAYPADAADAAAMAGLVTAAVARLGGIDILVANAGGHGVGTAADIADDDLGAQHARQRHARGLMPRGPADRCPAG